MATLQPGEKARMYALGAIARGGATRGGYVSGEVFIALDGQQIGFGYDSATARVIIDSLSVMDILDESPNTCSFTVNGSVPATGGDLVITLGSEHRLERIFGGVLLTVEQGYAANNPKNVQAACRAVDWTWLLGFQLVTKVYAAQSATTIAKDLIATYAGMNGFTANGVEANLPTLDEITFTNEDLPQAFTRLARRIGAYWKVDYLRDLKFGLNLNLNSNGDPETVTPSHKSFAHFSHSSEQTQALTRVYVEGRGSRLLGNVLAGDTMIPLEAVDMFAVASDVFAKLAFQGSEGGAQHIAFSGVEIGGTGSLVGPGAGPTNAPTATPIVGTGLSAGIYSYAYTDVTPTGETIPSPLGTVQLGFTVQPGSAPIVEPLVGAGGVNVGSHSWAYTYVTGGGGETTLSELGAAIVTTQPITPTGGINGLNNYTGGPLINNRFYDYRVTYVGSAGGQTTVATWNYPIYIQYNNTGVTVFVGNNAQNQFPNQAIPPGVVQVHIYRTTGRTTNDAYYAPHYYAGTANVTNPNQPHAQAVWVDTIPDGSLGAGPPATNTAVATCGTVRVTTISRGMAEVTGVKIYRTAANTTSPYKLVAQVAGAQGAVQYNDAIADSALGAAPPGTNTAGNEYRAMSLANISPGPSPTSARKIYRTVANGAQLKLLATLADNTTTTYTDMIGDGSLGANAPTGDTSGLQVPAGQVPAGSTTMIVANAGAFPAAGWAVIGNGEQVIRYTSKTATALTGIPATGTGSITAGIAYNSTATAASMLTGIPTTGTRAIQRQLTSGDEVYLVVQRDNIPAQDTIKAALGIADGAREEWVQDRRLSIVEARARGDATLKTRTLNEERVSYTCRDLRTASGKSITVNLPAPTNVQGTFKIQAVRIDNFRPHATQYPTFTVEASSARFSFEDWLRILRTKD